MNQAVDIFPGSALDSSLLTAVLIGVVTVWALSETLGWGMVGLVVPGYLAVVFAMRPIAGGVMVFEAVLSLIIARAIMDLGRHLRAVGPYFGRDRFFLILLVSIIVRQHCEHWLLPALAGLIEPSLAESLGVSRSLYSVGFVVVPLAANTLWNPGVWRGAVQLAVPTLVVYAVLVGVLLPATNLSFAGFELKYENLALEFVASPKTYIILLSAAFLASLGSRHFGWDVGGILVPALIALLWLTPVRIVSTLCETLLLVVVANFLIRRTAVGRLGLEGGRLLVFIFSLAYIEKWVLSGAAALWFPMYPVEDLFGFGYLLTTLLAATAVRKRKIGRVVLPALALSFAGFWAGSLTGFFLDQVVPHQRIDERYGLLASGRAPGRGARPELTTRDPERPTRRLGRTETGTLILARTRAHATIGPRALTPADQLAHAALWDGVAAWMDRGGPVPARVGNAAEALGIEFRDLVADRTAVAMNEFTEALPEQRGWYSAVLYPGATGPVIEVPFPWTERYAIDAAQLICDHLACRALVVAGVDTGSRIKDHDAALLDAFDDVPYLKLRVLPNAAWRLVTPDDMKFHLAERALEGLGVTPEAVGFRIKERAPTPESGHSQTLTLPREALLAALPGAPLEVLDERLSRWHRRRTESRSVSQTAYSPPSDSELNWLANDIVPSLIDAAARRSEAALRQVARHAAAVGYTVYRLPNCTGVGRPCVVLAERHPDRPLGWGTLVVAEGAGNPVAFEAPFPRREDTAALAVELFGAGHVRALLLADAELPSTSAADPRGTSLRNPHNPFHAIHEGLVLSLGDDVGVIQLRGLAAWRGLSCQLLVALDELFLDVRQVPQHINDFVRAGQQDGWLGNRVRFANGDFDLVGLGGTGNLQVAHARRAGTVAVAVMYFDNETRQRFSGRRASPALRQLTFLGAVAQITEAVEFATSDFAVGVELAAPPDAFADALARATEFAEMPTIERARSLLALESVGVDVEVAEDPQRDLLMLRIGTRGTSRWRALLTVGGDRAGVPQVTSADEIRAALDVAHRRGVLLREGGR